MQMRARVAHGKHVVVAVTIVTRGDIRRDVWLAELHRLAVVGFAIVLQPVRVALAAALVAAGLEMRGGGFLDVVRAVAVGADRAPRVAFGEQLSVDALIVGLLDAEMARAARLRDVGVVRVRVLVDAALDVVDAVAVVARRCDDQAHLHEGASVNAVEVVPRRVLLPHAIFLRELRIVVTRAAGLREIEFENG